MSINPDLSHLFPSLVSAVSPASYRTTCSRGRPTPSCSLLLIQLLRRRRLVTRIVSFPKAHSRSLTAEAFCPAVRYQVSGRFQIEVVALSAVEDRCLVNVVTTGAWNVAEMGRVGIGLIGSGLGCHLRIRPVAFSAELPSPAVWTKGSPRDTRHNSVPTTYACR